MLGGAGTQIGRRIEARVEQMSRGDIAERFEHGGLDAWMLELEIHQQLLDPLALQSQVAARRTAAADDRQLRFLGVRASFVLADIHQRPDDDVFAIV